MAKILVVLTSIILLMSNIFKCNNNVTMKMEDIQGKNIELSKGKTVSVEVSALGAAGYSWIVEKNMDDIVAINFTTLKNNSKAIGGPVKMKITLKALKAGVSEVKLIHKRGWEKDIPPIDSVECKITVQ